jgi:hypothetical protein
MGRYGAVDLDLLLDLTQLKLCAHLQIVFEHTDTSWEL